MEDTGIAIGQAVAQALGDKRGIRRYGDALSPMDETLTRVALDISGRPWLVWKVPFSQKRLGEMDTELLGHWFHSFAQAAGITLHVETLHGDNNHHVAESAFKGLARALRTAIEIDPRKADAIPSDQRARCDACADRLRRGQPSRSVENALRAAGCDDLSVTADPRLPSPVPTASSSPASARSVPARRRCARSTAWSRRSNGG